MNPGERQEHPCPKTSPCQWGPRDEGSQDPGHPSWEDMGELLINSALCKDMWGDNTAVRDTAHRPWLHLSLRMWSWSSCRHPTGSPCPSCTHSALIPHPSHPHPVSILHPSHLPPCPSCTHLRTPAVPRGSRAPGAAAVPAAAWCGVGSAGAAGLGTSRGLNPPRAGGWSH